MKNKYKFVVYMSKRQYNEITHEIISELIDKNGSKHNKTKGKDNI